MTRGMTKELRQLPFLVSLLVASIGCGGTDAGVQTVNITEKSFECLLNYELIDQSDGDGFGYYVTNLLGDVQATVDVADGTIAPPFPTGSLLQLFPGEAMVKREAGYSAITNDWEFFELIVNAEGTTINVRGAEEVVNMFHNPSANDGSCFNCHSKAPDSDFVCGNSSGCDPLPAFVTDEFIKALQDGDPRCAK